MLAGIGHQDILGLLTTGNALLEHDESFYLLHLQFVRHTDHAAHLNEFMGIEDVLQLSRVYVVSAGYDHAFDALPEIDEAVAVHDTEVSGMHPGQSVGMGLQGIRRLLRVIQIALHHRGTGQTDLTLLTIGNFLLSAGLDDLVEGIRERNADAALFGYMIRGETAGGHALRGAVSLANLDARVVIEQPFVETLLKLYGQTVAAGVNALQAAQVGFFHFGQTKQSLVKSGHAGNEVAAVFHDHFGIAGRCETRYQNAAASTDQHGVDGHAQAEAMEHGHHGKHLVSGPEHGIGGHDLARQRIEIEVGEQDPLGDSGSSARIQDHGHFIRRPVFPVLPVVADATVNELMPPDHGCILGDPFLFASLGEHIAGFDRTGQGVLDAGNDDVVQIHVLPDGFELAVELVQSHGEQRAGLLDEELDLLLTGKGVDHVGHGPHQVHGVEDVHRLGTVGHRDGDFVPGAHADRLQCACTGVDTFYHGLVGSLPAHEDIGGLVRVFLRTALYRLGHGAVGILQRFRHFAPEGEPGRFYDRCFTHSLLPRSQVFPALPGARADA